MKIETTPLPVSVATLHKLAGFIQEARVAMLTTLTADQTLHSRPLVTREVDLAGNALWFLTVSNFPGVDVILNDKEVALSYASADRRAYVSVSGRAHVVHDSAKMEKLWTPMASTRFPKEMDDPRVVLLRVEVEAVDYWDSP